jgi:hypothetical protein
MTPVLVNSWKHPSILPTIRRRVYPINRMKFRASSSVFLRRKSAFRSRSAYCPVLLSRLHVGGDPLIDQPQLLISRLDNEGFARLQLQKNMRLKRLVTQRVRGEKADVGVLIRARVFAASLSGTIE